MKRLYEQEFKETYRQINQSLDLKDDFYPKLNEQIQRARRTKGGRTKMKKEEDKKDISQTYTLKIDKKRNIRLIPIASMVLLLCCVACVMWYGVIQINLKSDHTSADSDCLLIDLNSRSFDLSELADASKAGENIPPIVVDNNTSWDDLIVSDGFKEGKAKAEYNIANYYYSCSAEAIAERPVLDYGKGNLIIFHISNGLYVYDLKKERLVRYVRAEILSLTDDSRIQVYGDGEFVGIRKKWLHYDGVYYDVANDRIGLVPAGKWDQISMDWGEPYTGLIDTSPFLGGILGTQGVGTYMSMLDEDRSVRLLYQIPEWSGQASLSICVMDEGKNMPVEGKLYPVFGEEGEKRMDESGFKRGGYFNYYPNEYTDYMPEYNEAVMKKNSWNRPYNDISIEGMINPAHIDNAEFLIQTFGEWDAAQKVDEESIISNKGWFLWACYDSGMKYLLNTEENWAMDKQAGIMEMDITDPYIGTGDGIRIGSERDAVLKTFNLSEDAFIAGERIQENKEEDLILDEFKNRIHVFRKGSEIDFSEYEEVCIVPSNSDSSWKLVLFFNDKSVVRMISYQETAS